MLLPLNTTGRRRRLSPASLWYSRDPLLQEPCLNMKGGLLIFLPSLLELQVPRGEWDSWEERGTQERPSIPLAKTPEQRKLGRKPATRGRCGPKKRGKCSVSSPESGSVSRQRVSLGHCNRAQWKPHSLANKTSPHLFLPLDCLSQWNPPAPSI